MGLLRLAFQFVEAHLPNKNIYSDVHVLKYSDSQSHVYHWLVARPVSNVQDAYTVKHYNLSAENYHLGSFLHKNQVTGGVWWSERDARREINGWQTNNVMRLAKLQPPDKKRASRMPTPAA